MDLFLKHLCMLLIKISTYKLTTSKLLKELAKKKISNPSGNLTFFSLPISLDFLEST